MNSIGEVKVVHIGFVDISNELESSPLFAILQRFINPVRAVRENVHSKLWHCESHLFVKGPGQYDVTVAQSGEGFEVTVEKIQKA